MNHGVGVSTHCEIKPTRLFLFCNLSTRNAISFDTESVLAHGVGKHAEGHNKGCPNLAASDLYIATTW
jgi:hypothetical protein